MIKLYYHRRLLIVGLVLFTLFSLLIYQFFNLQVVEGEKWSQIAKRQHYFVVKEPFHRGAFWSNTTIKKGHPENPLRFVFDIQKFHLYVDPLAIPEKDRLPISSMLAANLRLSRTEQSRLNEHFARKSHSRKLLSWLDYDQKEAILQAWRLYARRHKLPGNALYFVSDFQRSYPFGKLLGQVLHTVQAQRDEKTNQPAPTGGLELVFDPVLRGKQGKRVLKRSPRHSFETGQVIALPENGADVFLTINHYLQAIAEEEIEKGVKRCQAKCGWAVMMEPKTGEILAFAQYPFFYLSRYADYFNDAEKIEHTKLKGVTDAVEPGSVMKPITIALALMANKELEKKGEKRLIDPEEMIPCFDGYFPGRSQPLHDTHRHNYLNLNLAMQKSSNIYFARIAQRIVERMGNRWYRESLQNVFGLGLKTGVELPSESAGVVPTPGKLHLNGAPEWSGSTPYSLAMGHNIQTTTLQMLRAIAVLANGGVLVEPTVLRKVVTSNQEVLDDHTRPERLEKFPRTLDPTIASRVVKAMKYSTKLGGSGNRADIWGYSEAGKTGTANKIINGAYSRNKHVASFIGFAPADKPEFILMVVMDEPACRYIPGVGNNHHGSVAAAPVFKEIGKRTLEYLGVAPDDPHGYPRNDPRYDEKFGDWVKETRQLQEIYEKWNK